jgi:putative flippase GtrA
MEIVRFAIVGAAATLVHATLNIVLLSFWPDGIAYLINFASFAAAFVVSYGGHSWFTFGRRGGLGKFLAAALAGFALNNLLLALLLAATDNTVLALTVATCAAPALVYVLGKYWVFAAPSGSSPRP